MFTSLDQAQDYLEEHIRQDVFTRFDADKHLTDPLARMRYLLHLLGNPHQKYPSIQVTGTSGKGSTAYLISHILTTAGYKAGFSLSPHLQRLHERLQVSDKQASDIELLETLNQIVPAIKRMTREPIGKPSYFEILMAMAFVYFANKQVDIAVVEVGLEGSYDATNALDPLGIVLTNISLDHTAILGDTLEKIATEAVFAIKVQTVAPFVITGQLTESVKAIVQAKCSRVGAQRIAYHKDFYSQIEEKNLKRTMFRFRDSQQILSDMALSLRGDYQVDNASLAIATVLSLKTRGFLVSLPQIKKALATAFFPGRFEIVTYLGKTIILDGAHNDAKMQAFLKALMEYYPTKKKIFVVGFKKDKQIESMIKDIFTAADTLILTQFQKTTDQSKNYAKTPLEIKSYLSRSESEHVQLESDSAKALQQAIGQASTEDIIVITGSLYLVGEIRDLLSVPNQ